MSGRSHSGLSPPAAVVEVIRHWLPAGGGHYVYYEQAVLADADLPPLPTFNQLHSLPTQELPAVRRRRVAAALRLRAVALGLALAVSFTAGRLYEVETSREVAVLRCRPSCPSPSVCNPDTGRCEGTASAYVDAVCPDALRNGTDDGGEP